MNQQGTVGLPTSKPTTSHMSASSSSSSPTSSTPFLSKFLANVESTEKLFCLFNTIFSLITTILTAIHLRHMHYQQDALDEDRQDQNEILIDENGSGLGQ